MSAPTAARVLSPDSAHWYYPDGRTCYELPKKDGSGMKVPTLADARKLNLLPGVSEILKVLHKEGLEAWKREQVALAVATTPRKPDEPLDQFIQRVLQDERVQDEEMVKARDRGNEIHDAMEALAKGAFISPEIRPWVGPAWEAVSKYGKVVATEKILIGQGYGGRTDLILEGPDNYWLFDYKSTKNLPDKGSWPEATYQLSAYARAWTDPIPKIGSYAQTKTANVYISTTEQGKFCIWENPDWVATYEGAFKPLLQFWQFSKNFVPKQ